MKRYDRVTLSRTARELKIGTVSHGENPERLGTITGFTYQGHVRVRWDGNKRSTEQAYHRAFLEVREAAE